MLEVHSGNFSKGCSSYCKSSEGIFLVPLFHPYAARQEQFSDCQLVSLLAVLRAAPEMMRNVLAPNCSRIRQIILNNIFFQMYNDMKV